jgi:hypothetical protein
VKLLESVSLVMKYRETKGAKRRVSRVASMIREGLVRGRAKRRARRVARTMRKRVNFRGRTKSFTVAFSNKE